MPIRPSCKTDGAFSPVRFVSLVSPGVSSQTGPILSIIGLTGVIVTDGSFLDGDEVPAVGIRIVLPDGHVIQQIVHSLGDWMTGQLAMKP